MPLNRHGQLTVWRDIERVGGKTPHQKGPACWTACPTVPYSQERRAPRRQHREHDNRHVPSIKIEVVHTNGWFESPALPGSTSSRNCSSRWPKALARSETPGP